MHRLIIALCLLPIIAFSKQMSITITPDYPLTPSNTQLICATLHANLPASSLIMLDSLSHLPYTCKMLKDADGTHLVITLALKDS